MQIPETNQILTIAIPTYNRNPTLLDRLPYLLPQLTDQCRLLIIDNASSTPVVETVSDLLAEYPDLDHTVIRNAANIGGNANICRCFELCSTPYLWVLGDDDTVAPDAIVTVLRNISESPQCTYFSFASEMCTRDASRAGSGLDSFIENIDSFANILFVSACIFRADPLRALLRIGYHYAYAMAPHLAMFFAACENRGADKWLLSCEQIVHWTPPPADSRWPMMNLLLGFGTLMELVPSNPGRRRLAGHMRRGTGALEALTVQLLAEARHNKSRQHAAFLADQAFQRYLRLDDRLFTRFRVALYKPLFLKPETSLRILDGAKRAVKGNGLASLLAPPCSERL